MSVIGNPGMVLAWFRYGDDLRLSPSLRGPFLLKNGVSHNFAFGPTCFRNSGKMLIHVKYNIGILYFQGWQVSANSGLNRGLNRFKTSCQKQVFAGFYQTQYNNCSIKIMLTV